MSVVNTTSNPKTQGALVAGIGALIGIVAFLLLPYFNFTVTITSTSSFSNPQTHNGSMAVGTGFIAVFAGLIWVEALLAIAVLVLAGLLLSKEAPFGASRVPIETQIRRAGYAVIILGIVGIAYHFLFIANIGLGQIISMFQSLTVDSNNIANLVTQSRVSYSGSLENAIGSWIYLLGMAAAAVGGVLMLRAGSPQAVVQPQSWPQYAQYSQPSQPQQPQPQAWQHPSQPGWPQPQSQPLQPSQPIPQAWPQTQTQQQGWQPTQQAQQPQQPQAWSQPPQSEQRWQPPSFPSS